jgi:hypothetical protein
MAYHFNKGISLENDPIRDLGWEVALQLSSALLDEIRDKGTQLSQRGTNFSNALRV